VERAPNTYIPEEVRRSLQRLRFDKDSADVAIAALQAADVEIDDRLDDAEGAIATIEGDITTIEGDITSLGGRVTALEPVAFQVVMTGANAKAIASPLSATAFQMSTAGNDRGASAIDLQFLRSAVAQVASGTGAVVAGARNTASANYAVALGYTCTAAAVGSVAAGETSTVESTGYAGVSMGRNCNVSGVHSVALGYYSVADHASQLAFAPGRFAAAGDSQASLLVVKGATTNATETALTLFGATDRMTLIAKDCWLFSVYLTGVQDDLSNALAMKFEGLVKRVSNTTSIVGGVMKTVIARSDAAWDASVVADDTLDALVVKVIGKAATNIRWVARVHLTEVSAP